MSTDWAEVLGISPVIAEWSETVESPAGDEIECELEVHLDGSIFACVVAPQGLAWAGDWNGTTSFRGSSVAEVRATILRESANLETCECPDCVYAAREDAELLRDDIRSDQ